MSNTRTRLSLLFAALAIAMPVAAQSTPPVARAKAVAQGAVDKANARMAANAEATVMADSGESKAAVQARNAKAPTASPTLEPTRDSAEPAIPVPANASTPATVNGFEREVFSYDRAGRRDPFVSLMATDELRPLVSDLRLVAVAHDPTGRNSIAVLRDVATKDQYRVRIGQSLGRMRVSTISPRSVTFTIEEFGFSRQEVLGLGDSNKGSSK